MTLPTGLVHRRRFLSSVAWTTTLFTVRGALAEQLMLTPAQTEGPFYPDKLPLDTDNDLLVINEDATPALGEVTWVSGRILDRKGDPIRNATVEIWQCDANGVYIATGDKRGALHDGHFQGFGRFVTGSKGDYVFRTIKPVSYPGRTPHIHFAVKVKGRERFTTQCYIKGHPGNEKDGIWRGIRDDRQREAVTVDFRSLPQSRAGELAAQFDIVLGFTPEV